MAPSPRLRRSFAVAARPSAPRIPIAERTLPRRLGFDDRGATVAEYIVIVALIALGCIAGFKALRASVATASGDQGATIECVAGAGGDCSPTVAQACTGDTCKGPSCFVAGTPVATPSGVVPIERVRRGDEVLTFREETGEVLVGHVSATFVTRDKGVLDVHVRGETAPLRATLGHQFFTLDRGWVPAVELAPGEPLVDVRGVVVPVESLTPVATHDTVYNFEVEGTHTYFVGDARIAVHNPCGLSFWPFKKKSGGSGQIDPFPFEPAPVASGGAPVITSGPAPGYPPVQQPQPHAPVPVLASPQPPPNQAAPDPSPLGAPGQVGIPGGYYHTGPIAWVEAGTTVWRIDDRAPAEIWDPGQTGFQPRVPNGTVTIAGHQGAESSLDQYVSTANRQGRLLGSQVGRLGFIRGANLYQMRLPRRGADADATTGRRFREGEVTVAGGIRRECIESVRVMSLGGQLSDPVPNPAFNAQACH